MFNTRKITYENEEIVRTTFRNVKSRPQYSYEVLTQLRTSPSSKEVPSAALLDINLLGLRRRFRGRRGGRRQDQRQRHQQHQPNGTWRQPRASPDPVGIPVLTATNRLCRPTGPVQGHKLRLANDVGICDLDIAGRHTQTENIGTLCFISIVITQRRDIRSRSPPSGDKTSDGPSRSECSMLSH